MTAQTRKQRRKERRESRRQERHEKLVGLESNVFRISDHKPVTVKRVIKPLNMEQSDVLTKIDNFKVSVVSGRVGSGKTFLVAAKATEMLIDPSSHIEKIVLVRPPEPLGKTIGHLPGTKEEKLRPFLEPILGGVEHIVGAWGVDTLLSQGKLDFVAVEHLRGRTWNNCFVILDEANNLSQRATAVATLRVGNNCKVVFCGDVLQADIRNSGMELFMQLMEEYENVPFAYTDLIKTVRSEEASAFATMYEELGVEY